MPTLEDFLPDLPSLNAQFLNDYCDNYQSVFSSSRDFNAFRALHFGMVSELERKYISNIAKTIKLASYKSLLQLINGLAWDTVTLCQYRLALILKMLNQRSIRLVIEELGIPKKGKRTDYVTRQYMGNLNRKENGIIVLVAYGVSEETIFPFPITFQVFKPRERLKLGEQFKSKTQLAIEIVGSLTELGFNIETVLVDGFHGEDQSTCLQVLEEELRSNYVLTVSCRNQGWLSWRQVSWEDHWIELSDANSRNLFIRDGYIEEGELRCWQVSRTYRDLYFEDSSWSLITNVSDITYEKAFYFYLLREWIDCETNSLSDWLGWSDFQMKNFAQIERWWEISMSTHLMLSLYPDYAQQPSKPNALDCK
ncbi:MAG: IS701 family transposase [Elainellaceae cyanobacterium]